MGKRRIDMQRGDNHDWKKPKYYTMTPSKAETLTPEQVQELRADFIACVEHNKPIAISISELYQSMKHTIIRLFGEDSNQYRYWKNQRDKLPVPSFATYGLDRFEDWVKRAVTEPQQKALKEKIAKEQVLKLHNATIENAKKVTVIALRHGVEDGNSGDVYDALVEKDKYLSLGIDLLRCRNDFSEWKSARNAISNFKIETPQDKAISDDLNETIADFDGDGRIFRDCEWSYDKLFGLVDKQLYEDVMWLLKTFDIY
jgi:hypothetical protein